MIYELRRLEKADILFRDWQETMVWSCLQGVMGTIYVDSQEHPQTAKAQLGDFCFLAGRPDKEFVLSTPGRGGHEFMIMVPGDGAWADLIEECCGENARRVVRYAIQKEPDVFDLERLQKLAEGLPKGLIFQMMDERLFRHCKETEWCRDWVAQYDHYAMYQKWGLGVVALKDGEVVSGASSYSGYRGGIEIQIDTRKDCRRQGIACACGAKLILECLKRGWYPSWDAQNPASAALAEKLGYHLDHEYTAFEVMIDH